MTDWTRHAHALATTLTEQGAITDPAWHDAFAETPRHHFVPRFYAMDEYNSPRVLIDGTNPQQREEWLDAVYSNQVLVTSYQVAGHHDDGTQIRVPTSSASQPSLVAVMLDRLSVNDHARVLEIGTGTGYNTALLCRRVGDANVHSIDIDAELVTRARQRLHDIGYQPDVATGDGAHGLPGRGEYHHLIATCATPHIPAAWINQLANGGTLVTPMTFAGALLVARKTGPGEMTGRFDPVQTWFMPLRRHSQPGPSTIPQPPSEPPAHEHHHGTTTVDAASLNDPEFRLWLHLHAPHITIADVLDESTGRLTRILAHTDTHTATAKYDTQPARVTQDEARLWDTVETAWRSWQQHNRPTRNRLGLTATADNGQHVWLDTPDSPHSWPLPTPPLERGSGDNPDKRGRQGT